MTAEDSPAAPLAEDAEILDLIRQEPGICLRQLATLLWPDCSWQDVSQNPAPADSGAQTRALWLRDRLRVLLASGRVLSAPFHHNEPGLAGLAYLIPSS